MPSYKVITKGFLEGVMYDPDGKRRMVHRDKPFDKKKMPSWLKPIKSETAGEKKKREAVEKKTANADADKARQDKTDIDNASFMGDGESDAIETL